ncbi:MAG TPA: ADP/ATP-dependent (S)-NAD(P)H-hydrate dehydratase, partial [Planctomycetota bacterium]
ADRAGALQTLVERSGATVLLKGAGTLLGAPGQAPWTNPTGNPGMATAGSGDVLTGVVAGLLARGLSAWDAARLGAWLHGRAGDLAAAQLGEESLMASDLLEFLPAAMQACRRA